MANSTTDSKFAKDVLQSKKLVLVDFWAEWCGPCRQLGPTIDEIAKEMKDVVDVFKMDIDANPDTPTRYGIRSIPTLILVKDGQLIEGKLGALPKHEIVNWINAHSK